MAIRFLPKGKSNYGQPPLRSGYESTKEKTDMFIPPVGIEDIDTSLFKLFKDEIKPVCGGTDSSPTKNVPIIFAAGEKWALLKKGKPIKDRNNTLIIPLITVMRTDIVQASAEDITGRGINQQVGELVVRRKLDKSDRSYQSLINRFLLGNQSNLAVASASQQEDLETDREIGSLSSPSDINGAAYLNPNLLNNVIETIVVPTPQFFTAKYIVTIWTQYMQHSNQILEKIITSFLPQGNSWRLDTPKGYWFVATVENGDYATETNFEDQAQQERFIKHSFNVNVPGYFFASRTPGSPIPIKRYLSCPIVRFEAALSTVQEIGNESLDNEYSLGSDDPTLPLDEQMNDRNDQRTPGWRQQKVYPRRGADTNDPVFASMPRGKDAIKVITKSANGETVYSGANLGDLEIVIDSK
jgi:hypothetical protein